MIHNATDRRTDRQTGSPHVAVLTCGQIRKRHAMTN